MNRLKILLFLVPFLVAEAIAGPGFPGVGGGGASGGGNFDPTNVAITGGTIQSTTITSSTFNSGIMNNNAGLGDTWTNSIMEGSTSWTPANGLVGSGSFWIFGAQAQAALAVDITQMWGTLTLTNGDTGHPNETLTFSGTPAATTTFFRVLIFNSDTVVHNLTVPNAFSFNKQAMSTTFSVQPSCYVLVGWYYDGTNYYIVGDPTNVAYRSIAWNVDNGASVLAVTNPLHRLNTIPAGSTIIGWEVFAYPSGSVTFDIFKAAAGSTPSVSITGSAQPTVSSGTQSGRSATLTGWTTSVSANDVFDAAVTAATTTTNATVIVFYAPTL